MEKNRTMTYGQLENLFDTYQIPKDTRQNLSVVVNDSELVDSLVGTLGREQPQSNTSANLITVRKSKAKKVLGGISENTINRGGVPGVHSNIGDATVTIDMNTDWVRRFNITEKHFRDGVECFIKAPKAAIELGFTGSKSLTQKSDFDGHRFKVGRIWLYSKQAVANYAVYKQCVHPDSKPALRTVSNYTND
jgi:hypothetical protein